MNKYIEKMVSYKHLGQKKQIDMSRHTLTLSNSDVLQRTQEWLKRKEAKTQDIKEYLQLVEQSECTFHPALRLNNSNTSNTSITTRNLKNPKNSKEFSHLVRKNLENSYEFNHNTRKGDSRSNSAEKQNRNNSELNLSIKKNKDYL